MGILVVAHSNSFQHQFTKGLIKRLLPDLTETSAETLEIVTDVDQVSTLLSSLAEAKNKKVVSFEQSFMDLQSDI